MGIIFGLLLLLFILLFMIVYYLVEGFRDFFFKPHIIRRETSDLGDGYWNEYIWYTEKRGEEKFTIIEHKPPNPKTNWIDDNKR